MGKRLRKAPEGTSSIKSFFTPLGKSEANTSKSSSSDSQEEDSECIVDSDSDWEVNSKRKRPRKSTVVKTRASARVAKAKEDGDGCRNASTTNNKRLGGTRGRKKRKSDDISGKDFEDKEVDLEIVAFLKSGIPAVAQKLNEIRKDNGKKTVKDSLVIEESSKEKEAEKEVDLEVIAFLKSGVPAATVKAQKLIDIRREEEEATKCLQYFPVITHVPKVSSRAFPDHSLWQQSLGLKIGTSLCCELEDNSKGDGFVTFRNNMQPCRDLSKVLLCCKACKSFSPLTSPVIDEDSNESSVGAISSLPWIEKHSVNGLSHLAVDGEALEKIEGWLKRWKNDIKDDGGKSRKLLEKRKRKGAESDFIESESDAENNTKSLLVHGHTGAGKTATVVALAKKLGFKIVEVNFSTSRSGKDVLRRVEEATLSHRLEASHLCLLLFKDICLIEPKEDEGFVAAVAQLITSSCRPIVMTMSIPTDPIVIAGDCDSLVLDSKIEKKDPLPVYFPTQPPSVIVKKVLLPIVQNEFPAVDPRQYTSALYSIARHCNGDIRQSINQMQFLLQTSDSEAIISNYHIHVCPYLDFNFLRKNEPNENSSKVSRRRIIDPELINIEEDKKDNKDVKKSKAQIQQDLHTLDRLRRQLCSAIDLDLSYAFINRRSHEEYHCDDDLKTGRAYHLKSCFLENFKLSHSNPMDNNTADEKDSESQDSGVVLDSSSGEENKKPFHIRSYIFDCDKNVEMEKKVQQQYVKLEEYCGTVGDLMTSGSFNFDNFAYVRTIIKTNKMNSSQKRNRRVSCYFNRLGAEIVEGICDTFDFQKELRITRNLS